MKQRLLCILTVLISTIIGASRVHAQVQWNTNLLQNTVPIGSQYKGWQKTDGGTGWDIDNGYFVSSFQECILKQTVTLADYGFTADNLSGQSLYASVRYVIPWPGTRAYGGICIVAVVCLDESGNTLETLYLLNMTGYTNVDIASTVKDSLFVLPTGTTQLRYELHGRDQKNWGGYYGPRFTDMKMIVPNRDSTYTASIDPAIGDSITLNKTNGIHIGDTVEVSATYPEYPIRYLFSNGNQYINTNRLPCKGVDMVVSARFSYRHTITLDTQHATLTASKTSAYAGDTITLTRSMKEKHFFIRYIATPEVQWLDGDRFIMPDEDIEIRIEALFAHTLPFFEGFENGNKQGAAVSGWLQQQIFAYQNEVWKANSTDTAVNRAPYMGKWNANLFRGNTRLLFTYLRLEAGVEYRISMYARQNATTGAAIQVFLGDTFERDAMTQTILPTTQITDGDYQHLTAVFSVSESKDYALGIYGYIGYDDAIYLSLDNISITRNQQNPIRCTLSEAGTITASKTSAMVGDTITLSHTMSTGYLFIRYVTNIDVHWLDSNRFVMPYTDVQIDMETFDPHPIRFTSSEAGTITADKTNAPVGDTITLSHAMNAGYRFIRYTATPEVQWLNGTCFIMPDKEVEIGMEVNAPHSIRFTSSEAGTITANKTNAPVGDTITLSHTMNAGYRFIRYTATPEVRWLDDNRFIMLDEEVEIGMEVNAPHSIRFTSLEAGTITADKTSATMGDTVALSHTMNARYIFVRYTATPEVRWLDDNHFIMLDEEVEIGMETIAAQTIPFFEGFEEGNTEGDAVSGWTQQNEIRTAKWQANQGSYRNTSPYQGAWNAILSSNNAAWLFRWVYLEAGKTYRLGMYARQNYADTDYASMSAYIGSALDKDSMLINVIPETGLTDGDYQLLASTFSVVQTGIYALGIRGMINTRAFFLSLDNISLDEYIPHTIRTTESEHCTLTIDKTEAYMCDTVSVTANVNDGYFLDSVRTDISVEWIDDTRFIMPNADVVLTAYIHKAKTGVLHIINTDKASIRVLKDGVELPDNSIITEGDILCSVAVAGPGYKLYTISPDDTICSVVTGDRIVNDTLVMNTSGIGVRWFGPKPRVECPDSTTAIVIWDSIGCEYDVLITDQEVSDFTFQKGIRHTADTAYTAQGLTEGKTYYAYLRADKAGEEEMWNSNKFVMLPTEFGESCTLVIDCYDSFGDGWNENALLVEENGLTTRFTFDDGSSETFTYLTQGGTITIYWEEGSYPRETSFVITTADGAVLVEVSNGSTLQDGEQLYFGNPCNICLQPVITDICHKGTDITVSWTNTGAASYNVALLNKGTATDEELATLHVSTTDTMYTFHDVDTCKYYMAYVQAQCDEKSLSAWVTGYYAAQPAATLQWEPITLNFYVRGNDAIADGKAYPGTSNLCLLYRLTLTEAQTIYGHTIVDDNYTAMLIGSLKNDTLTPINSLFGNSVQLAAGDYGIMAVVKPGHEYEVFIAEVDTMQFTHITLPYLSDTIMNDGLVMDNTVGNGFFRGYEFTLNETTTLEMSLKDLAPNEYAQLVLWRYENGQNNLTSNFMRQVQPLDSGTYRIGVFTYNQNVPYRLSLTASLPSFAFDTIAADTVLTGTISAADRLYPMDGASLLSKAYTFTLEEQQCMNVRLYATSSDSMLVVFYTDSILLEREDSREAVGMNDSTFYTDIQNRHGETKRYYMVVYNLTGQEQSFACALHTYFSSDSVLASDTMHINEIKMLAFDAYSKCVLTNGYNGVYEAYTMHLEKDKRYRFYAEAPETALAMNIYAVDPARKKGHLSNNSIAGSSMVPEYRTAIATGVCPEEKDYTLVLTADAPFKLHDEPKYMLAFEEMQDFRSLIGSVQEVVLPFRQDTAFGKVKYSGDNQWRWHPVNYDYISSHSIYSAVAYMVKVNAGDTLYASLTTDYDAVIHFYHFYGATDYTDCNMRIYDAYEGYPQIAEKGMYVNTTDSVETIVVIASDNNYRPGGNHYRLILSRSLTDINVEKTAFAEASESVIYCDSEISIVRDALSRLTLTAKDENGLTIGTIDNIALYWDINLSTGIATYEVNDADLPNGYTFGGTAWIPVSVRSWETVFPMADKSSIVLTEYTESAAREALGTVVLTAVDADGKTVHTFTNTPANWTIDLTTGLATYTLQNTDLPRGYVFENATETVSIQLKNGLGIENVEGNALLIYPNPASDYTFIEGATQGIQVYDLVGRLVLTVETNGEKTMLDLTGLPSGMYHVRSANKVVPLLVK